MDYSVKNRRKKARLALPEVGFSDFFGKTGKCTQSGFDFLIATSKKYIFSSIFSSKNIKYCSDLKLQSLKTRSSETCPLHILFRSSVLYYWMCYRNSTRVFFKGRSACIQWNCSALCFSWIVFRSLSCVLYGILDTQNLDLSLWDLLGTLKLIIE